MINRLILEGKFRIRNAVLSGAAQMEYVQSQCYPTLHESEILLKAHFENHIKIFPEGQFVIEIDDRIIASTSTFRCDFPHHDHNFLEATDNLWLTNAHKKDGDWIYGIDMGVIPEFRGLGLSRELYLARQDTCKQLGIKGQITVGMTIGYGKVKDKMTIQQYCEALERKEFTDPTITPQRNAGFRWIRPIYGYINDPEAGFGSILMYYPLDEDFFIDF